MCTSCCRRGSPRLRELRLPHRMRSSRAAALTTQLQCRGAGLLSDKEYTLRVQRRQLPMTIKTANTHFTLQGVTANPGLIFHWKFPHLSSEELRWLAAFIVLSRLFSLAQLIFIGIPADLRSIIEDGPPENVLLKCASLFQERKEATHMGAAEVMREL